MRLLPAQTKRRSNRMTKKTDRQAAQARNGSAPADDEGSREQFVPPIDMMNMLVIANELFKYDKARTTAARLRSAGDHEL